MLCRSRPGGRGGQAREHDRMLAVEGAGQRGRCALQRTQSGRGTHSASGRRWMLISSKPWKTWPESHADGFPGAHGIEVLLGVFAIHALPPRTCRRARSSSQESSLVSQNNQEAIFTSTATSYYASLVAPRDTVPPSVPAGVAGVSGNPNTAILTWSASTDNIGVAGY